MYPLATNPNIPQEIVDPISPPIEPSIVFLGLTFGHSFVFPNNLPA